jgi:hypothetical protein
LRIRQEQERLQWDKDIATINGDSSITGNILSNLISRFNFFYTSTISSDKVRSALFHQILIIVGSVDLAVRSITKAFRPLFQIERFQLYSVFVLIGFASDSANYYCCITSKDHLNKWSTQVKKFLAACMVLV